MSYFRTLVIRVQRKPWMFLIFFSYPIIVALIIYVSFAKEDSFRMDVGLVLPSGLRQSPLFQNIEKHPFGPYHLHLLDEPSPQLFAGKEVLSALLVVPDNVLDRLRRKETITIQLLTNPDEQVKPAIVEDLLRLGEDLVNALFSKFEQPIQASFKSREVFTLEENLKISKLWYNAFKENEDFLGKLRDIQIYWQNIFKRHEKGTGLFGSIFWVMILANLLPLLGSVQMLFFHDLREGLSKRWRAIPNGLQQSYRDILIFSFCFGWTIVILGGAIGVFLLNVPSPSLLNAIPVLSCLIFFMIGFNQFGMMFVQSERAMKAFMGFGGMVAVFILGGLAIFLPHMFGPIGRYLPFKIGIEALIGQQSFSWILGIETIPIGLLGIVLYYRKLMREEL